MLSHNPLCRRPSRGPYILSICNTSPLFSPLSLPPPPHPHGRYVGLASCPDHETRVLERIDTFDVCFLFSSQSVEAVLFLLEGVASNVTQQSSPLIQNVLSLFPHMPPHPTLVKTTLSLLGVYCVCACVCVRACVCVCVCVRVCVHECVGKGGERITNPKTMSYKLLSVFPPRVPTCLNNTSLLSPLLPPLLPPLLLLQVVCLPGSNTILTYCKLYCLPSLGR